MKIYTKAGDKGKTFCSFTGTDLPKSHPCIEFIGALDEAETTLGYAWSISLLYNELSEFTDLLKTLEDLLFRVGFSLSTSANRCISSSDVEWIEKNVDRLEKYMTPSFTLNGGHIVAASVAISRAAVRRAERRFWECIESIREVIIKEGKEDIIELASKILNRASDLLFVAQHAILKKLNIDPIVVKCKGRE